MDFLDRRREVLPSREQTPFHPLILLVGDHDTEDGLARESVTQSIDSMHIGILMSHGLSQSGLPCTYLACIRATFARM